MSFTTKELDEFSAADVFDIRDLIERFEELEDERNNLNSAVDDMQTDLDNATDETTEEARDELAKAQAELAEWIADNGHEFKALQDFLDETKGYGGDEQWRGDWYPVTFIARSYFVEYCQNMLEEDGVLPHDIPSYLVIDWEATAKNLEADYSTVDLDGNEFLYR